MTVHFPFQNSYSALPDSFFARVAPTPVSAPRLIKLNRALAVQLGLLDADTLRASLERSRARIAAADNAALTNRIVDLCGLELFLRAFLSPAEDHRVTTPAVDLVSC